ncbi:MAG: M48 family metalloprotease [Proteobacteria bacterium]|nr:M48 family metalloprotease [Pseudomonadota bacterium]
MDFFAAQAAAHSRTRALLAGYVVAVGLVVGAITWVVAWLYTLFNTNIYSAEPYSSRLLSHPGLVLVTATGVLGIIGIATLHRMAQLSAGGGAVAVSLGASRVTRETADPKRRRLLNVVEEMAIASGVPVPEVYVLDQEPGINAFAAGFTPADAAITVTRGALERLNRAELAGVIGHEFSHLLNGDMRLNTRLAGPLFGLLVIAIVARYTLRGFRGNTRATPFLAAGLVIMGLGYLGVLLGRLLQSAICRQREFLADASSVQFTRDATALRDALVTLGRAPAGSHLHGADGEDLAHLFIAPATDRLFSTHPPLAMRIRRLDPHFDVTVLDSPDLAPPPPDLDDPAAAGLAAFAAHGDAPLSRRIGNPGVPAVAYAAALRAALPAGIEAALARGTTTAFLWLALALSAQPPVRERQVRRIAEVLGEPVGHAVAAAARDLSAVPVVQHLPLLQRALPVLKALPVERRRTLVALTAELARADGRMSPLEYLLGALATRYLGDQLAPPRAPGRLTLEDCAPALGTLFAVVAYAGDDGEVAARRAYERGLAQLLPRERPAYAAPDPQQWAAALDAALARLADLAPPARELLVDALGRTVLNDGSVRHAEAELLRAVCALLDAPLPPLLPLPDTG